MIEFLVCGLLLGGCKAARKAEIKRLDREFAEQNRIEEERRKKREKEVVAMCFEIYNKQYGARIGLDD